MALQSDTKRWTYDKTTGVLMYDDQPVTTLMPKQDDLGPRISYLLNLDEGIERMLAGTSN